mmetsp:Transcript_22023/g.61283  ORF Transcript_22023/g.61283 Transcript_22023/m.61283 type:complete len:476 (-) Transcript_22023:1967-3394(-)
MTTPVSLRQKALVRSLYRKILRECERIPPTASLLHLHQRVGDTRVGNQESLRTCIRSEFRHYENGNGRNETIGRDGVSRGEEEGIRKAIEGLKYLLLLDTSKLSEPRANTETLRDGDEEAANTHDPSGQRECSSPLPANSDGLLESVEWLPHVSEINDTEVEASHFPVFPLSGPLFPDDDGGRLPLISQFSETPVVGMEVPLRIFEPRYREMYRDLLSSTDGPRRFIVPFSHPYRTGQFAALGWMYEIVGVRDVADESNGRIQLLCNHIVSRPVRILRVLNPTEYDTKATYLRARAELLHDDAIEIEDRITTSEEDSLLGENSSDLLPLQEMLRAVRSELRPPSSDALHRQTCLIDRLLIASGENSVWPVAQAWISHLQIEILRLQGKISTRIQWQAAAEQKQSLDSSRKHWKEYVTEDMLALAQEPHKHRLRGMLIEVSTLIPLLLQQGSHRARCRLMHDRIRDFLTNETEPWE